jgi:hypothetical protein
MLTTQLSIIDASDLARRIPYTVRRSLGAGRPQRSSSIQVYKVCKSVFIKMVQNFNYAAILLAKNASAIKSSTN